MVGDLFDKQSVTLKKNLYDSTDIYVSYIFIQHISQVNFVGANLFSNSLIFFLTQLDYN